ncbi:MAG: aspartate carbamoyltransferase [Ignisphaera sp.]|uniref:Aspartate carbamoyltransferase n=1 Tax=Ignisphaera aggregans TaxID=334771 RepID=A0A7C4NLX9_9CREN
MSYKFKHRDVISILDFTREDLEFLFEYADKFLNAEGKLDTLKGKVVALAFFEPSTRSRLSFEVAAKKLGADVISIIGEEATSIAKGESFADTMIMLDAYSDIIVVRHRYEGAAKYAAEIAEKPVINAGDGRQHHPTQAMIDLYTVMKLFGTIDNLTYAVLGDLRYGRAATSFIYGLTLFKPKKVYLVSPPLLRIRNDVRQILINRGLPFEEKNDIFEVIEDIDVLYVTRIQKERFPDPMEYERVKGSYIVTLNLLEKGKPHLKVLHPLPKVDEIDHKVDTSKYAAYYYQAKLGIPIRMALLTLVMGVG